MANEKILVVDDDTNICELLRLYLTKEGYQVTTANDGEEGLDKFNQVKPDMVLLDVMMPKMDGPANGFLNAVCNISPQTANAPPQSSAVSAWGKRDSQRMKLQPAFSPSPPSRIRKTSAGGIETDPTSRLPAKSNKITTPNPIPYFQPLLIVTLFSTQRHGGTEFSITFTKVPYLCVHHSFSLQK